MSPGGRELWDRQIKVGLVEWEQNYRSELCIDIFDHQFVRFAGNFLECHAAWCIGSLACAWGFLSPCLVCRSQKCQSLRRKKLRWGTNRMCYNLQPLSENTSAYWANAHFLKKQGNGGSNGFLLFLMYVYDCEYLSDSNVFNCNISLYILGLSVLSLAALERPSWRHRQLHSRVCRLECSGG